MKLKQMHQMWVLFVYNEVSLSHTQKNIKVINFFDLRKNRKCFFFSPNNSSLVAPFFRGKEDDLLSMDSVFDITACSESKVWD